MDKKKWIVYLVRCADGSLYCGVTNNLGNRLSAHNSGRGAKYTRSRRPVKLAGVSPTLTKSDAFKLEYFIKQVPAGKKREALSKGLDAFAIHAAKELASIRKELGVLTRKIEKLIASVRKIERVTRAGSIQAYPVKTTTK